MSEYTPPLDIGKYLEVDTTPDHDGDIEVCNTEGDHIAYLTPADQIALRDLLNKLQPLETVAAGSEAP